MAELLADENIVGAIVYALRADGHDVTWVREDARGIQDIDVLTRARREQRILPTNDTDFGAMIYRDRAPAPPGVVLMRLPSAMRRDERATVVRRALVEHTEWIDNYAVFDRRRVRFTRLPGRS